MTWKLRLAGLGVLLLLAGFGLYKVQQWGRDAERAKIERENSDAASKADDGRVSRRECVDDLGGVYDFATGKCSGSSVGGWWRAPWGSR